ncbi:MAG: glycosyltransferase family 2 protein [Bryobacteraceae bacterium]
MRSIIATYVKDLVSCILPTRDRPGFFRQAVRCFLRQSYVNSELVVVDDGEEPVGQLFQPTDRIVYVRLNRPASLGTKMNIGIARARGSVLQKMDDDDYYHPEFLETAVSHLAEGDRNIVAWDCFLVLFAGEREARFSGHGWASGGTLCFSRRLWERAPFRDAPRSVDRWFLTDHEYRITPVCAAERYLVVRHGRNTWTRMDEYDTDDWLQALPIHPKPLEELMSEADAVFYRGLRYDRRAYS